MGGRVRGVLSNFDVFAMGIKVVVTQPYNVRSAPDFTCSIRIQARTHLNMGFRSRCGKMARQRHLYSFNGEPSSYVSRTCTKIGTLM